MTSSVGETFAITNPVVAYVRLGIERDEIFIYGKNMIDRDYVLKSYVPYLNKLLSFNPFSEETLAEMDEIVADIAYVAVVTRISGWIEVHCYTMEGVTHVLQESSIKMVSPSEYDVAVAKLKRAIVDWIT